MLILALISAVVLLVWMGFFMMGSLPLLVLKHDTPVDSRFIRGLFNLVLRRDHGDRGRGRGERRHRRASRCCPGPRRRRGDRLCGPALVHRAHGPGAQHDDR